MTCVCLCLSVSVCVQELVEMRPMETSASSTIPAPVSGLENQGRAASMPRLNAELQVTPNTPHDMSHSIITGLHP